MDATDALKEHVLKKMQHLEKYLQEPCSIQVILSVEKINHIVQFTIVTKGTTIKIKDSSHDMYTTIDKVIEKSERKLLQHKEIIKNHKSHSDTATASEILSHEE